MPLPLPGSGVRAHALRHYPAPYYDQVAIPKPELGDQLLRISLLLHRFGLELLGAEHLLPYFHRLIATVGESEYARVQDLPSRCREVLNFVPLVVFGE